MLLQNTECSPAAETVKAAYSQNWACRKYWSCQARDACFYHFGVLKLEVLRSKRSSSFQDPLIHHSRCPCPAPDSVSGGVKASSLWKAALSTWRQQQQHSQSLWTPRWSRETTDTNSIAAFHLGNVFLQRDWWRAAVMSRFWFWRTWRLLNLTDLINRVDRLRCWS